MKCETLQVWQKGVDLSIQIYQEMASCRNFGFVDQITRSGLSIASNIAEGMEKSSTKDQIRFLEYSKGSTAEFITQAKVGLGAGFISGQIADYWQSEGKAILGMLRNLEKALANS